MKNVITLLFVILLCNVTTAYAQQKPTTQWGNSLQQLMETPSKKKKIETSSTIQISMNYDYMLPSLDGKRFHDTSLELRGWNAISFLDIYWSWNFSNFINIDELSNLDDSAKNYQYGVLAPRLSLNKMFRADLSFLVFKEWFISYRFEFDSPDAKGSNLLKHNLGIGIDFAIPLFERFKTNIYARYTEKNYGRNNYSWNGYLFSVDYLLRIYKFQSGIEFLYEGWLDVIFGAKANRNEDPEWTSDSVKWKNTFKVGYKGFAVGYTYQFNMNLNELKYKSSDISQQSVGISYTISF